MKLSALLHSTRTYATWYLALVVLLPIASLSVLGLLYLWDNNGLLLLSIVWLAITVAGFLFISWQSNQDLQKQKEANDASRSTNASNATDATADPSLPKQLDTPEHWSDEDTMRWDQYCEAINQLIADKPNWEELPAISLQLLETISADYHPISKTGSKEGNIYRFTLPEALLVLSVASSRYRDMLITHIPFVERINVSSLLGIYKHKTTAKKGWGWFNKTRRIWRLTNPLAAAVGEIRDHFTRRLFYSFSDSLQNDLKRLLLQEVVQSAMELYSGGFKRSDSEMRAYQSTSQQNDLSRIATSPEPMRVVLLGQTSSGKSSLVNALIQRIEADVDHLPATQDAQTHVLTLIDKRTEPGEPNLDNNQRVHLIDTPGIHNDGIQNERLIDHAMNADVIVVVARANQPARAPDQLLLRSIIERFEQSPQRRQPPMFLALTHIDQLPPRSTWSPPYDLTSDEAKANNIAAALSAASKHIGMPEHSSTIPVCLSPDKGIYNVDAIVAQLFMLREQAISTQLNRRRIESGEAALSWSEQWSVLVRLGRVMGRAAKKD